MKKITSQQMMSAWPLLIILQFAVFVLLARWTADLRIALFFTAINTGVSVYAAREFYYKVYYRELRNRYKSYHIVGLHPDTGDIPVMYDFHERCIFVKNRLVQKEAARIKAELDKANEGVAVKDRHPVQIYTYSFREPVSDDAVIEKFQHKEGKIDNSYARRIMDGVIADTKKTERAQYKASIEGYRAVEMGQEIPKQKPSAAINIEW